MHDWLRYVDLVYENKLQCKKDEILIGKWNDVLDKRIYLLVEAPWSWNPIDLKLSGISTGTTSTDPHGLNYQLSQKVIILIQT